MSNPGYIDTPRSCAEKSAMLQMNYVLILFAVLVILLSTCSARTKDGLYLADVYHTNFNTGHQAQYELITVEVKNTKVVKIHFPKGGSLHSGPNSSGYSYTSSKLKKGDEWIDRGYGVATVKVVLNDGTLLQYIVAPWYSGNA